MKELLEKSHKQNIRGGVSLGQVRDFLGFLSPVLRRADFAVSSKQAKQLLAIPGKRAAKATSGKEFDQQFPGDGSIWPDRNR